MALWIGRLFEANNEEGAVTVTVCMWVGVLCSGCLTLHYWLVLSGKDYERDKSEL